MTKFYTILLMVVIVLVTIFTFSGSSRAEVWTPPQATIMLQPLGGSSEPWGVLDGNVWLPGGELDVPGANYFKGATLDSYVDDGNDAQLWAPLVDPLQSSHHNYTVVGIMSVGAWWGDSLTQLCLTATSTVTVNLELCPPGIYGQGSSFINSEMNQLWYWKNEIVPCPSCIPANAPVEVNELVNYYNGRCLTIQNGSPENGAEMVLGTCNGSASQIAWAPEFCTAYDGIDFGNCSFDNSIVPSD